MSQHHTRTGSAERAEKRLPRHAMCRHAAGARAYASLMSRRNATASSGEFCFSSQDTWLIILSRTSLKARISTAACAASRSPIIKELSDPLASFARGPEVEWADLATFH
jgi:hypothetical protein